MYGGSLNGSLFISMLNKEAGWFNPRKQAFVSYLFLSWKTSFMSSSLFPKIQVEVGKSECEEKDNINCTFVEPLDLS